MSFASGQDIARTSLAHGAKLGFDRVTVSVTEQRLFGVRVAQGVICRENVARDERGFELSGEWHGREAACTLAAGTAEGLSARLTQLRRDIELQPANREHVAPATPHGSLVWDVARGSMDELYGPDVLYPLLAAGAARVRDRGLQLTGYVEAQELHRHSFHSGPGGAFDLRTRDHGIVVSVTVADARTGAVGATSRASVYAPRQALEALLDEALQEATRICLASANPRELSPGDYTVVMHPVAVLDFINTAVGYGLFDRRKIDEGRTYLSGKLGELAFPQGLSLAAPLALELPLGVYADLPLNHRDTACTGLTFIGAGRVQDLHTSAFWAKRSGAAETFVSSYGPPLTLAAAPSTPLSGKYRDLAALIAGTERGIYVANTWYLRMVAEMDGTLTGMTRDGLFAIEDGKLAYPLLNMRWHDNPLRMLGAVSGLSDERTVLGRGRLAGRTRTPLAYMPAARIESFHLSSVTKF